MGGERNRKFCVICGVEEEIDKEAESGVIFSRDGNLVKFCGELEMSSLSLNLNGDKGRFVAFNFLQQLDKCGEFVVICGGCSLLIGETVVKRGMLEGVECEVLELQIKLLIKLKELEGVSKLYLGEMGKIRDKVKGAQLNGLVDGRDKFGKGNGKCDILGFRERILNVITSLAVFQDNLNAKLKPGRNKQSENDKQVDHFKENDSELNASINHEDNPDDFDNPSPPSAPPTPDFEDDPQDNLERETALDKIKMEADNPSEDEKEELRLNQDKPKKDKPKRKSISWHERQRKAKQKGEQLSQVNWSLMGPLKTRLIKSILTGPGYHQDNPFKKYKWTYLPSSDQVNFANYPIKVSEDVSIEAMTLECTSCGGGDPGSDPGFKISSNMSSPSNLNNCSKLKKTKKRVEFLKSKVLDHVLHFHLNLFNCPNCGDEENEKLNLTSLRRYQQHLNLHDGGRRKGSSCFCEICGKTFAEKRNLQTHLDWHLMQDKPEEADKLKKFQCETCGKRFYQLGHLKGHEDSHKPKEERQKVICSFCGKGVLQRCYPIHKKYYCRQQAVVKKLDCWICGKWYKNEKSFGDHLVRTHKLPERPKF